MNPILDAPAVAEQRLEYAGFWIRVVAIIIDAIVLSVVFGVLGFALIGGAIATENYGLIIIVYFFFVVGGWAYFAIMESSSKQATLGKMAVGIKVGNERGERISAGNALGRVLSKIISGAILYIGYIMVAFDARKQGLHDKIASTIVYYG